MIGWIEAQRSKATNQAAEQPKTKMTYKVQQLTEPNNRRNSDGEHHLLPKATERKRSLEATDGVRLEEEAE
jgi:hypothetical protein